MKLTNTTRGDLALEPGACIPAGQTVDIRDDVLKRCENSPVVQAWVKERAIVVEAPEAAADAADKPKRGRPPKKVTESEG